MGDSASDKRRGVLYALGAYGAWGVAPLYFRALRLADPFEIVCHRVVWSVVFLLGVVIYRRELGATLRILRSPRAVLRLALSSALIASNWLIFIYCVANGLTLDASFGYFINPIISIALGVMLLGERLTRVQVVSLSLALIGVAVELVALGRLPWLSLTMAVTFALYGLARKQSQVGPLSGLAIETLVALPFALLGLLWFEQHGLLAFGHHGLALDFGLVCTGLVTAIPLLLFVAGAQRIPLSLLGFLQYVAPSMQFAVAVAIFHEPLNTAKLVSFAFVWLSLLLMLLTTKK